MSRDDTLFGEQVLPGLAPGPTALLTDLRNGTRAAHARMETNKALSRLLAADLRAEEYVFALQGLQRLHTGIASRTRMVSTVLLTGCLFDTARLALLDDDLAWFNARPARPLNLSRCITDAGSALGALYVLEGSALGARIIGKAVRASLSVEPGKGGSYFCGATADAARRRWTDMSDCINRAGASMDSVRRLSVVRSANAVFQALERSMQPNRVRHLSKTGLSKSQSRTNLASATIVQPVATGQQMN